MNAAHYSGHPGIVNLLFARGRVLDAFLAAELGMAHELRAQLDREPSLATQVSASGATDSGTHAGETPRDTAIAQGQTAAADALQYSTNASSG